MTDWRKKARTCHCGVRFKPKRAAQRYHSERCRNIAVVRRKRSGDKEPSPTAVAKSGDMPASGLLCGSVRSSEQKETAGSDGPTMVWGAQHSTEGLNPDDSTPGALPGNYPLEYYPDGHPKLPPCLDRRRKPALSEAA